MGDNGSFCSQKKSEPPYAGCYEIWIPESKSTIIPYPPRELERCRIGCGARSAQMNFDSAFPTQGSARCAAPWAFILCPYRASEKALGKLLVTADDVRYCTSINANRSEPIKTRNMVHGSVATFFATPGRRNRLLFGNRCKKAAREIGYPKTE